ncbi:MAG: 30S ribosome-binding factor RbfA [Clostridiales bacterium]|nr:30S ribosome-binding factor RbfA [Clostridiales bacterium]
MRGKREQRLNSEFQKEIYDILKNKIKNPNITEMFSILEVDVTNDLKYAKVYVSIFSTNGERGAKTFNAIKESAKAVRSELAKIMRIRTVPELTFILDTSADYGNKIEKILSTLTYNTEATDDDLD